MTSLDDRFWSQVWRCRHRWPCKRCCWPWHQALVDAWKVRIKPRYGRFTDAPDYRWAGPAHRFALMSTHGALFLPFGRDTAVCHLCHFPPCCNPCHLVFGTQQDNIGKMARESYYYAQHAPIRLPNGNAFRFDAVEESLSQLFPSPAWMSKRR